MRRGRPIRPARRCVIAILAGAVPAVAACSASDTTAGGTATAPTPSAASPAQVTATLTTCDQRTVSAPSRYTLACADAGIWLDDVRWSAWGSPTAHASAKLWKNDCDPNCVAGHDVSYPASVTVSGLTNGRYTRIHVEAPQAPGGPYDYTVGANGPG